jgi:hypothetical protein
MVPNGIVGTQQISVLYGKIKVKNSFKNILFSGITELISIEVFTIHLQVKCIQE